MVSDPVRIALGLDASKFRMEAKEVQTITDDVTRKWRETRRRIKLEVREVAYTIRSVVGVVRSAFRYFGISLDPVTEAIIGAITTSLTSILAIHRALEASTLGMAGVVTVGLSALAIGMSAAAVTNAIIGMNEAKDQAQRSTALLQDVEQLIQSFLWVK